MGVSVSDALSGVLTLLIIIAAGFVMCKTGAIDEKTEEVLSKITLRYSIPFLMFDNALRYIDGAFFAEMGFWLVLPFCTMLAGWIVGSLLLRLFRVKLEKRGLTLVMFGLSNSIFIGLPVVLSIFGERGTPYLMAYVLSNTVFFWTFGKLGIARDGGVKIALGLSTFKELFSPPLTGFLAGTVVSLTGLQMPEFFMSAVRYMGGITVPMALILAGVVLGRMGREVFRMTKEGALTLTGRFLVLPALTLGACLLFGADPLMAGVYTTVSAMPVMSQAMIIARHYNADYPLAAKMLTLSTLLCLVFIPLLIALMGVLIP